MSEEVKVVVCVRWGSLPSMPTDTLRAECSQCHAVCAITPASRRAAPTATVLCAQCFDVGDYYERGLGHRSEALERAASMIALVTPAYFQPPNLERATADVAAAVRRELPILVLKRSDAEIPDGFFPKRAVVVDFTDRADLVRIFPRIEGELTLAGIAPAPALAAILAAVLE